MTYDEFRKPLAILSGDILQQNVFENSPKYWSNYILASLFSTLQKSSNEVLNMRHKLKISSLVDIFIENVIRSESFVLIRKQPKFYEYISGFVSEESGRQIVTHTQTRPTWSLVFYGQYSQLYHYVSLDLHLEMNITFIKVFFARTVVGSCGQAKCLVCADSFRSYEDDKIRNVKVRILNDIEDMLNIDDINHDCHIFCGIYSAGNFYPLGKHFQLQFFGGIASFVDMFFSVMDQSRIETEKYLNYEENKHFQWIIFFPQKDICIEVHYLSVDKFQIISVYISHGGNWWPAVYDGPSSLSSNISFDAHTGLYRTTTFHCTKYMNTMMHTNKEKKITLTTKYYYFIKFNAVSPVKLRKVQNISVTQNDSLMLVFGLSDDFCGDVCEMNIASDLGFHLNISILDVIPTGPVSADCRFSGISFYDVFAESFSDDTTFCGAQWTRDNSWKFRNIFSSSNSLLVLFYRQHVLTSNIIVNFTVSVTHCKSLKIDICKIGADFDLFTRLFDSSRPGHKSFSMENKTCLNLWIDKPSIFSKRKGCSLFLRAGDIETAGLEIEYHITGFFPQPVYGLFPSLQMVSRGQKCSYYTKMSVWSACFLSCILLHWNPWLLWKQFCPVLFSFPLFSKCLGSHNLFQDKLHVLDPCPPSERNHVFESSGVSQFVRHWRQNLHHVVQGVKPLVHLSKEILIYMCTFSDDTPRNLDLQKIQFCLAKT